MMMFEEQQLLMCYGVMYHFLLMLVSQEKNQTNAQQQKKITLLHFKSIIAISWYFCGSQGGTRETSEELSDEFVPFITSEICCEEKKYKNIIVGTSCLILRILSTDFAVAKIKATVWK